MDFSLNLGNWISKEGRKNVLYKGGGGGLDSASADIHIKELEIYFFLIFSLGLRREGEGQGLGDMSPIKMIFYVLPNCYLRISNCHLADW